MPYLFRNSKQAQLPFSEFIDRQKKIAEAVASQIEIAGSIRPDGTKVKRPRVANRKIKLVDDSGSN